MTRFKWFLIACALFALSCNGLQNTVPTVEANIDPNTGCPYPKPTNAEVDRAREYKADEFGADWTESYTVMDNRITVTHKNTPLNSVINFDTVNFCAVTNASLDDYYTEATFNIIFQYYDDHKYQNGCRSGDLRLYEFDLTNQGYDYNGRFWVEIVDENHTRETLLVFPVTDIDNFNRYSDQLMPKLASCN